MPEAIYHQPVLYQEIIHALQPVRTGIYVDCTVGAGGHAAGILNASDPEGRLLGLDLDPVALELAKEKLASYRSRTILIQASYVTLSEQIKSLEWLTVDGILLDLGLSSMQLDSANRGFSFKLDGPLDMRFDPGSNLRASDLVNELSTDALANIIFKYGEERQSRRVARAIVTARPIRSTRHLAEIVAKVTTSRKRGIHPATRTFQAIRIAVNSELERLEAVLPQAVEALSPAGRLVVIAYHSLEDRIVKLFFRKESSDCICPPRQPICTCGHRASLKVITKKPICPSDAEVNQNPRSRSARMRVAERLVLT
jgi:16S rRNA (cytosine1402-N4)-methyltransferase